MDCVKCPIKICRICFTSNLVDFNRISKTRRCDSSFRRFCSEINYKGEVKLDRENVTICVKCMPLVESVSESKCRVEEVEGQVLKLQRKLLNLLNELEEELGEHFKGMEKLEEIVEGSGPQPEVFGSFGKSEVRSMMEFRKRILEAAQDLRGFRADIRKKITRPDSTPPLHEQLFIKLEATDSPPNSPLVVSDVAMDDTPWFPEADDNSQDSLSSSEDDCDTAPQYNHRLRKRTSSSLNLNLNLNDDLPSDSNSEEDDPPPKMRKEDDGLKFILGRSGKRQLVYEGYRYNFHRKSSLKTTWACVHAKRKECLARVQTEDGDVVVKKKHNHPNDEERIEVMRIINKIKERGDSSVATIKSIISSEGGDAIKLPSIRSIVKMVKGRNKKLNLTPIVSTPVNPDDFDKDLSAPIEFIKSRGGNDHLVFKGYRFMLKQESTRKKIWRCVENRKGGCKAYLHVVGNKVTLYKHVHSHSTDSAQLEAMKIKQKLKEASLSTTKSASEILTSIGDVSDDVAAKLPTMHTLAREIRKKRNHAKGKVQTEKAAVSINNETKVIPIISPLEFVKSKNGNDHLMYEGYRFYLKGKGRSTWVCTSVKKTECRARLVLKDGCISGYQSEHNHPRESAEEIEKRKLLANIKESCLANADNPGAILAETGLGNMKVQTVKRMIRKVRCRVKSSLNVETPKDRILRNNPEIFLMNEFMQEVVIAMIISEERRQKNSKAFEQFEFGDPSLTYTFRFDWNEKKIFLGEIEVIVNENLKSIQCAQCGSRFGTGAASTLATQIFDHIIGEHFVAYNCPVCNEIFNTYKTFQEHIGNHVDPEEPCDICGKSVTRRTLEHHKSTHLGEEEIKRARKQKKHTCAICGKSFATSSSIRRHERLHD